MEYKGVPGFEDKFEIGEDGIVRNVKTKRETKPYHTSEKTGPMVHLLDTKAGKEARLPVIRLVDELFGKKVPGWDLDPKTIGVKTAVERKPRLTDVERAAREKAKEDARVKREAERDEKKAKEAEEKAKAKEAAKDVIAKAPKDATVTAKPKKARDEAVAPASEPATEPV
jgi:hypothetical protein